MMMDFEIYKAINAVQAEMATVGIQKDKKNLTQGYNFRGIDDVYGALAPIIAKHKLCIIPFVLSRSVIERTTQKGGVLFYVTVECEFHFVSAIDGSKHIAKTYGEAMDSADKATNKAMSAAYKYAAFQTFCIPVDAQDADAITHDVAPQYVNDEQQVTMIETIQKKQVNVKKFLEFMKCSSLESIPASEFNKAMAALRAAKGQADATNN
jgi:primase-polymerase (primpol)-like protein